MRCKISPPRNAEITEVEASCPSDFVLTGTGNRFRLDQQIRGAKHRAFQSLNVHSWLSHTPNDFQLQIQKKGVPQSSEHLGGSALLPSGIFTGF